MKDLIEAAKLVNAWWSGFMQDKDVGGTYTAEIFEKLRSAVYKEDKEHENEA